MTTLRDKIRSLRKKPVEISRLIPEIDDKAIALFKSIEGYTMTGPERQWAMLSALRHILGKDIPGDVVECGVWRGGNLMMAATVLAEARSNRVLYGFDTYAGMSEPTEKDVDMAQQSALGRFRAYLRDDHSEWAYCPIEKVAENVKSAANYPHVRLIKGKCEDTLKDPANLPDRIALLRLDTDWYESTRVELEALYPRLSSGGILIIDDYGHWGGAREATDEFLQRYPVFMTRIDYTARLIVKP